MSKKVFLGFLDNIPDSKLQAFPARNGQVTIYMQPKSDGENYRLDKQSTTADNYHNLQIQANRQAKSTSVRKNEAPNTVATVLVLEGSDPPVTPKEIRSAFKQSYLNRGSVIRLGTIPKPKVKESDSKDKKNKKGKK